MYAFQVCAGLITIYYYFVIHFFLNILKFHMTVFLFTYLIGNNGVRQQYSTAHE
jgi:hypothetical protein